MSEEANNIKKITVIGSGTMGAGIAQTCAVAGFTVSLQDIDEKRLEAAYNQIVKFIRRGAEKNQYSSEVAEAAVKNLSYSTDLAKAVQNSDWVIEAIFENMAVKKELYSKLDEYCHPRTNFASNTSGLSITEIGAASGRPEQMVGMHFFNPVPLMKLVEVIRGAETSPEVFEQAVEFGKALGKTVVQCQDSPNFIVNQINRPVYFECQMMVQEGLTPQVIDTAMRLGASFKMGPLETGDWSGLEIGLSVSENTLREFGDPKYRPMPIVRKLVRAGNVGRKAGKGFYLYPEGSDKPVPRWSDIELPKVELPKTVAVPGDSLEARRLRGKLAQAGFDSVELGEAELVLVAPELDQDYKKMFASVALDTVPGAILVALDAFSSPSELGAITGRPRETFRLFCPLSFVHDKFYELALGLETAPKAAAKAVALLDALDYKYIVVPETPIGVTLRVICCMINEAAFCLQEKLASVEDIDTAMRLGMNYGMGPFQYADKIGVDLVLEVMEHLQIETGDPRYRPAQLLRKMVRARQFGQEAGRGFYDYF